MTVAFFTAGVLVAQDSAGAKKKSPSTHKAAKKSSTAKAKPVASTSKSAAKTPVKSAQTSKSHTARTASHRRTAKSKKPVAAAAHRSTQRQPTPERYKEIQQALADKGYFSGPADGNWGPDSVEALKRFQREQNLTDDGKLGSLSLIAMGLGPKRAEPAPEKPTQR